MFCCTKKEDHFGQIINSICLEQECIKNKNQLSCANCISQQHQGHSISTMKKIMPDLLNAHKQKQKYFDMLNTLLNYVRHNFGEQNENEQNVTIENLVDRSIQIMNRMKNQVETNNQQIYKMKEIFKNLNKVSNNSQIKPSVIMEPKKSQFQSHQKYQGSPSKISKISSSNKYANERTSPNKNNNSGSIDIFSHSLKHPYLSVSSDNRTVVKSSHPGHRYSILTTKALTHQENEVQLKINNSPSGNIMVGLCHQNIVRQKDFVNNYGTGHGTYLIGQNGQNPNTAISFHHSLNIMNRKQIVGWNFGQNDLITIGFNFNQDYIYFKLQKGKGKTQQFSMALYNQENKESIGMLMAQQGLKIIVLLQNVGDQLTLLEA